MVIITLFFLWSYPITVACQYIHEAVKNGDMNRIWALLAEKLELVRAKDPGWCRTPLL